MSEWAGARRTGDSTDAEQWQQDSRLRSAFHGATVLVTGGAGFIGSHLVRRLARLGAEVRVLDDLSTGSRDNLVYGSADLIVDSVLNQAVLERSIKRVRYVFHLAAVVGESGSAEHPERCYEVNGTGTLRVLEAARRAGVSRAVLASSCAVYGRAPRCPSREEQAGDPWSPYVSSKLTLESMGTVASRCHGLGAVTLRYFDVYGPRQRVGSPYSAALLGFAQALLAGQSPTLHGDGRDTRDFTFVDDAVSATLLAALAPDAANGRAFNVGTGRETSSGELLRLVSDELGVPARPHYAAERRGASRRSCAALAEARRVLGYEPRATLEQGLVSTLTALRARCAA